MSNNQPHVVHPTDGIVCSKKGFFIGDPTCVLSDIVIDVIWGNILEDSYGIMYIDEARCFGVGGVQFGNGEYQDEQGNSYSIHDRAFGIVPLELVEKDGLDAGVVVHKPGIAHFHQCDGIFDIMLPEGQLIHLNASEEVMKEKWAQFQSDDNYVIKDKAGTVESNAGFYIGDPRNALSDAVYYGSWGHDLDFAEGVIHIEGGHCFAVAKLLDDEIDKYMDDEFNMYTVRSGHLALIPLELVAKEQLRDGRVCNIPGTAHFHKFCDRVSVILPDGKTITIDTY